MERWKFQQILVENGLVEIPPKGEKAINQQQLATILNNIAYYGFALSEAAYLQLCCAEERFVEEWWNSLNSILKSITGADRKMGDFVVYKNFPKEVLDMSETEYWLKQILMYWGFPNKYFTQEPEEREIVKEKLPVKVLQATDRMSLFHIRNSLFAAPVRWTKGQWKNISQLLDIPGATDISLVMFKENMVQLAAQLIKDNRQVCVKTATDVLRLAVGLSDGDITMRTNTRLRRFKRTERRFLLSLLEGCKNLEEDIARRREPFKRLFHELHPGDYKERFPRVVAAYDKLYRGERIKTFNSEIERLLLESDQSALDLLKTRPGEFLRRLRVAVSKYGDGAVEAFLDVLPSLTIHQLLKIKQYLLTINDRNYRVFPPKGNWTKLKVVENSAQIKDEAALYLVEKIGLEIKNRVAEVVPLVKLSKDTEKVKLQGNDSNLTPYGRGTIFDIPNNITFLRSASYWKTGRSSYGAYNVWFDNGWNFFDENWKNRGVCCWTEIKYGNSAVFSGDPTNAKDLKGRACQMIDLYLDKLREMGVRYAVWNILCYSHKTFDEVEEVYAALQWGENLQGNNLFEPSRCVLTFPVRGANKTKYIAYVDVQGRKLIYMDANLFGNVSTAASNGNILEGTMPAFVEYLNSLPSVHDLFEGVPMGDNGMPVLYDDNDYLIEGDAYVFLQRNKNNDFNQFDINSLLNK